MRQKATSAYDAGSHYFSRGVQRRAAAEADVQGKVLASCQLQCLAACRRAIPYLRGHPSSNADTCLSRGILKKTANIVYLHCLIELNRH